MCTGADDYAPNSSATGPVRFDGTVAAYSGLYSGITAYIVDKFQYFGIESSYISGDPISSGARFNNITLTGLGVTTTTR